MPLPLAHSALHSVRLPRGRFNLLKVRLQYDYAIMRLPLPVAIYTVLRNEGVSGAWRGLPPRLIWSAPLAAATFTYYQSLKRATGGYEEASTGSTGDTAASTNGGGGAATAAANDTKSSSKMGKDQVRTLVLGPAVMALSVGLRTPFDIVEQQLQLTALRNPTAPPVGPPSPMEVARRIQAVWQKEGYRGVWRVRRAATADRTARQALTSSPLPP